MRAGDQHLEPVGQHGQPAGDFTPGVGGIDELPLGGDVRVQHPLGVVGLTQILGTVARP